MSLAKSLAVGLAGFLVELLVLGIAFALTNAVAALTFDWSDDLSHGSRSALSIATFIAWWACALASLVISITKGSSWLGISPRWPLFIGGVLTGLVAYFVVIVLSETNACLWDVGFPLGGECWSG